MFLEEVFQQKRTQKFCDLICFVKFDLITWIVLHWFCSSLSPNQHLEKIREKSFVLLKPVRILRWFQYKYKFLSSRDVFNVCFCAVAGPWTRSRTCSTYLGPASPARCCSRTGPELTPTTWGRALTGRAQLLSGCSRLCSLGNGKCSFF